MLIRSEARKAFFSAPLMFNVPSPKPKNVHARRERNTLTVTWDFPSESSATRFLVTVNSRLRAMQVKQHSCTFKMDDNVLSEDLEVMVYAISEDDIRSAPGIATFISHPPNESTRTMSPVETRIGTRDQPRPRDVSPLDNGESSDRAGQCDTLFMEDTWADDPDNSVDYSNESAVTREPSGSAQVCWLFYNDSPPGNYATRFRYGSKLQLLSKPSLSYRQR